MQNNMQTIQCRFFNQLLRGKQIQSNSTQTRYAIEKKKNKKTCTKFPHETVICNRLLNALHTEIVYTLAA